jgi:predicted nucleotidyltransferase
MTLNEAIQIMTSEIVTILGDNKPSVYLYGSVALNDFKLGWSDIDLLVLTKRKICAGPAETLVGLRQSLLERYPGNPYFRLFEGGMRSVRAFLANRPERTVYWGTSGQRITDSYYFDSFSMAELLDSGRLLYGEDVRDKFTYPTYSELRDDVRKHYLTIRKHGNSVGWLLDIARGIYTLQTGKVIAKTAAGEWALESGIFSDTDALLKAVQIRKTPLSFTKEDKSLEYAVVQRFADVLERELVSSVKQFAESELSRMGVNYTKIEQMQYKDGVSLWQIDQSFVLKCLDRIEHRREIDNYKALAALEIPTLKLINSTNSSILIENIEQSEYRLGKEADLNDPNVIKLIAEWYKLLHKNGREYAQMHDLYDECNVITLENINIIKDKTYTAEFSVWTVIEENFETILSMIMSLPRTLTYNDFYYTNLVVARSGETAMMFDYNLLGKGYVYSDIRNVCSSLGAEAKEAFTTAYGAIDKFESVVDDVASVLTTLYFACERKSFPAWAMDYVEKVKNSELLVAVKRLLETEMNTQ